MSRPDVDSGDPGHTDSLRTNLKSAGGTRLRRAVICSAISLIFVVGIIYLVDKKHPKIEDEFNREADFIIGGDSIKSSSDGFSDVYAQPEKV